RPAVLPEDVLDVGHAWHRLRRVGELRAPGEGDRLVQSPPEQTNERQHDEEPRQREPPVAVLDDLEVRNAVAAERSDGALDVHLLPPAIAARTVGAGSWSSMPTAASSPMPFMLTRYGFRAIQNTVGRLKNHTTNRSSSVQSPSVRANPRT